MIIQTFTFNIKNEDYVTEFCENFHIYFDNLKYDSNKVNTSIGNENVSVSGTIDQIQGGLNKDVLFETLKNKEVKSISLSIKVYSHGHISK